MDRTAALLVMAHGMLVCLLNAGPLEVASIMAVQVGCAARRGVKDMLGRVLVVAVMLTLTAPSVPFAQGSLPDGVPNVLDPRIRESYQPFQVGNLENNPDFPVVVFMARGGQAPAAVMVALDARNGKESWSLARDPIILIAVFAEQKTVSGVYLDSGFTQRGAPNGTYTKMNDLNNDSLPRILKSVAAARTQTYM